VAQLERSPDIVKTRRVNYRNRKEQIDAEQIAQ
jgi:hypothetical protein